MMRKNRFPAPRHMADTEKMIRRARSDPFNFTAIGGDLAAHLALEASAIRRCDDYSASAVASMLENAARSITRSQRAARQANLKHARLTAKPRKTRTQMKRNSARKAV